eukprot:TRINITY_DN112125_c0_g1_i1.p1 TRINITY_DN112125_c0_g1~~TRINITY_DN112125_c0_g1_i1.p1  ORF type:complete len:375 (+),score=81.79 TRINITY_DN112125_c0_g1_i1:49-1125(+)
MAQVDSYEESQDPPASCVPPDAEEEEGLARTVEVSDCSFERLKLLMVAASSFNDFFLAASAASDLRKYCYDSCGIRPVTKGIEKHYGAMVEGPSLQSIDAIGGALQKLAQAFRWTVRIDIHTFSGQPLHIFSKGVAYDEWQGWTVGDVFEEVQDHILASEAAHLKAEKEAFVRQQFGITNFDDDTLIETRTEDGKRYGLKLAFEDSFSEGSIVDLVFFETSPRDVQRFAEPVASTSPQPLQWTLEAMKDGMHIRLQSAYNARGYDYDLTSAAADITRILDEVRGFPSKMLQVMSKLEDMHPGIEVKLRFAYNQRASGGIELVQGSKTLADDMPVVELLPGADIADKTFGLSWTVLAVN